MTSRTANYRKAAAAATASATTSSSSATPTSSSRQRWQPEEDALVQEYVRRHGPREWHLLRSRMGVSASRFPRDPKSCAERWKNYLRPGLKKGPLSPEEQALALALQKRHGNRWKLIAKSLPGRTPKRLGKWWEVFSYRQRKQEHRQQDKAAGEEKQTLQQQQQQQQAQKGRYDHILDTYVEKHVLSAVASAAREDSIPLDDGPSLMSGSTTSPGAADGAGPGTPGPVLSLGTFGFSEAAPPAPSIMSAVHMNLTTSYVNSYYSTNNHLAAAAAPHPQLPAWLSTATGAAGAGGAPVITTPSTITAATPSSSQSVGLSLTSSTPSVGVNNLSVGGQRTRSPPAAHPVTPTGQILMQPQLAALGSLWQDLEDSRQGWMQHRKESAWRLGRLEQQLGTERARRAREKMDEMEARVRALREEQAAAVERIEMEYREQLAAIQRDAESREGRLLEGWAARHARLARVLERVGSGAGAAAGPGPVASGGAVPFPTQFPLGRPNNGNNN